METMTKDNVIEKAIPFKTNCELNVPKKYQHMIKEVDYEGKDSGYWLYLQSGYVSENGCGSQTIHEYSKASILKALQKVVAVKGRN